MAGYTAGTDYTASNNGQPAPTGQPALDATTLANLGLSASEAQGIIQVDSPATTAQGMGAGPDTTDAPINPATGIPFTTHPYLPPGTTQTQTSTVGQSLQNWYNMDSDQVEQLQHQLWDAGLYPKSMYTKGQEPAWGDPFADSQGFSAYRTLLRRASTTNKSINSILDASAGQGAAKTKAGFSPVLTNPDDLRAIIKSGAPKVLGQNISDAEVEKIVAAYQQADYQAKYAQFQANTQGGATSGSPNPTDFVNQQLQQLHPDQAAATTFNNEANAFLQTAGQTPHI